MEYHELAVESGEVILRGESTGRGSTVLLLHAGAERRQVWDPVAAVLRDRGLRAVAFDQRGHGQTGGVLRDLPRLAADVAAMIASLEGPVTVVGASLGGLAAMAALADPATARRMCGLVLVDVVPDPEPASTWAWLVENGLAEGRHEILEDIMARGAELRANVAATDVPILLVRGGARSRLTDHDAARFLATNPRADITRIRGAGHLVAREAPRPLGAIIARSAVKWAALGLLRSLGAESVSHPGGGLLAHLERVHDLTAARGATRPTQLAARPDQRLDRP